MAEYDYLAFITKDLGEEELTHKAGYVYQLIKNLTLASSLGDTEVDLEGDVPEELGLPLEEIASDLDLAIRAKKGSVVLRLASARHGYYLAGEMYLRAGEIIYEDSPYPEEIIDEFTHRTKIASIAYLTMQSVLEAALTKNELALDVYDEEFAELIGPGMLRKRLEKALERCGNRKLKRKFNELKETGINDILYPEMQA